MLKKIMARIKSVINPEPKYQKAPPQVFFPTTFDEINPIVTLLKNQRPVIVNLNNLDSKNKYRIIDFLSGFVFALQGKREKLEIGIYLFYL